MRIKIFIISILIYFANYNYAFSTNFKNYSQLDECLKNYNNYYQYKIQIKKCFNDQGIKIKNDAIKLIEKKSGIIDDIINLKLPGSEKIEKKKKF